VILRFKETLYLSGPFGTYARERTCVEHPRITHLEQQLQSDDGHLAFSNAFRVNGVPGYCGSVLEALDVLRANPLPDDIVAVPPLEISEDTDEEVHRNAAS